MLFVMRGFSDGPSTDAREFSAWPRRGDAKTGSTCHPLKQQDPSTKYVGVRFCKAPMMLTRKPSRWVAPLGKPQPW